MKDSKILGYEWEPIGTSYEEVVKVSRDTHYPQVAIMQSLIAILHIRIEKKLIEIKKNIVSDRRVYPVDIPSLSEAYLRLYESLKSYIRYIDIQPLSDEEISMMYLEKEITKLIETTQRRHCK